jgi:hypothetical protein
VKKDIFVLKNGFSIYAEIKNVVKDEKPKRQNSASPDTKTAASSTPVSKPKPTEPSKPVRSKSKKRVETSESESSDTEDSPKEIETLSNADVKDCISRIKALMKRNDSKKIYNSTKDLLAKKTQLAEKDMMILFWICHDNWRDEPLLKSDGITPKKSYVNAMIRSAGGDYTGFNVFDYVKNSVERKKLTLATLEKYKPLHMMFLLSSARRLNDEIIENKIKCTAAVRPLEREIYLVINSLQFELESITKEERKRIKPLYIPVLEQKIAKSDLPIIESDLNEVMKDVIEFSTDRMKNLKWIESKTYSDQVSGKVKEITKLNSEKDQLNEKMKQERDTIDRLSADNKQIKDQYSDYTSVKRERDNFEKKIRTY